jgi:lysozyme
MYFVFYLLFNILILKEMETPKLSEDFYKLLHQLEGLPPYSDELKRYVPYLCPAGNWTHGIGSLLYGAEDTLLTSKNCTFDYALKVSNVRDSNDCSVLLARELKKRSQKLFLLLCGAELLPHQYEALLLFYYNCGVSDTLFSMVINQYPLATISNWWRTHYVTANGKKLNGLIRRREIEAMLFIHGYERLYSLGIMK